MANPQLFVSFSLLDRNLVYPTASLLIEAGAAVTLDDEAAPPHEVGIPVKLQECDRLVVFWSAHTAASKAVAGVCAAAIELGKMVVPILLDATPLLAGLGRYPALDFREAVTLELLPDTNAHEAALLQNAFICSGYVRNGHYRNFECKWFVNPALRDWLQQVFREYGLTEA
jgi:hypothetical protein